MTESPNLTTQPRFDTTAPFSDVRLIVASRQEILDAASDIPTTCYCSRRPC